MRLAGERVTEARAVVDVGGHTGTPRQQDVAADVQCVALIVVELAEARVWIAEIRGEIRQPSGDGAAAVGDLVGIRKMKLCAMSDAWRTQRQFPSADEGLFNREGEEEVGFSDGVVVEEIPDTGTEGVGVERPPTEGDGDAELMLFDTHNCSSGPEAVSKGGAS